MLKQMRYGLKIDFYLFEKCAGVLVNETLARVRRVSSYRRYTIVSVGLVLKTYLGSLYESSALLLRSPSTLSNISSVCLDLI